MLIPCGIIFAFIVYASKQDLAILNTSGEIARRQHEILSFAFWLSMVVIIPVFALTIFISIRYRNNKKTKSKYSPNWAHNTKLETIWWGIPIAIIFVLSVVTWRTSHTLDPYKPLDNSNTPVSVQVVALQWKWLFLYPEENIATVNQLVIPENRPINFTITADAPMNSFWIPKLGGQVYAMNGMSTKLHLIADTTGEFEGMSANISGEGFADMRFKAIAKTNADYLEWTRSAKLSNQLLNDDKYNELSKPSTLESPETFSEFSPYLYNRIISKFMSHGDSYKNGDQNTHSGGHN